MELCPTPHKPFEKGLTLNFIAAAQFALRRGRKGEMGMRAVYVIILAFALVGFIGSLLRAVEKIANAVMRREKAEYTAELITAVFSALICIFMILNL